MVRDDIEWFRRLADVPGVDYGGRPEIDRNRLPGHDATPEVHAFEMDGVVHRSLSWRGLDRGTFSTSSAPARQWRDRSTDRKLPEMVQLLYESLELPGQLSDYHFNLLGTYDVLWNHRSEEPWIPAAIEELCLLDMALVEARMDAVEADSEHAKGDYYVIPGFHHLVRLYEQEGYLQEALAIAHRAAKFGQLAADVERLTARIQNLEAADAN